jgi:hypothetical protein
LRLRKHFKGAMQDPTIRFLGTGQQSPLSTIADKRKQILRSPGCATPSLRDGAPSRYAQNDTEKE